MLHMRPTHNNQFNSDKPLRGLRLKRALCVSRPMKNAQPYATYLTPIICTLCLISYLTAYYLAYHTDIGFVHVLIVPSMIVLTFLAPVFAICILGWALAKRFRVGSLDKRLVTSGLLTIAVAIVYNLLQYIGVYFTV